MLGHDVCNAVGSLAVQRITKQASHLRCTCIADDLRGEERFAATIIRGLAGLMPARLPLEKENKAIHWPA